MALDDLESQADFARRINVSKQAVGKMVRTGKITLQDGKVPIAQALAALGSSVDLTRPGKAMREPSQIGEAPSAITAKKAELLDLDAERKRLDLARQRDAVVERAAVCRDAASIARIVRDRVMALPQRIKRRLAQENDPEAVRLLMEDGLRDALHEAAAAAESPLMDDIAPCLTSPTPPTSAPPGPAP